MIAFAWSGFPQYAARCVGALVKSLCGREDVIVLATRPKVPIEGMEKLCGCNVKWIDGRDRVDLPVEAIKHLFVSGWGIPAFNSLRDRVKANGGKVYAMVDNNLGYGVFNRCREVAKAIRFRLALRAKYDGFFVPGKSGTKLMKFYGIPADKIKTGLYSADASLFRSVIPIWKRSKRIIYVGQICERKNVVKLVSAFLGLTRKDKAKGWRLELYGCGPQEDEIRKMISDCDLSSGGNGQAVALYPFQQPEKLAEVYGDSRIFILPSKEEHWGLVLHEAALSGCVLLASRQVGAAEDFIVSDNGRLFSPNSVAAVANVLKWAMELSDAELERASRFSSEMAENTSLDGFVRGVSAFVHNEAH